jgi:glycosyltransferase involved in cell wall biosynthesis
MKNTSSKLLTITIPTYNRCSSLKLLLDSLRQELIGFEKYVSVVISDNASNDNTPVISQEFSKTYTDCKIIRHPQNIGMDENFISCAKSVQTKYFWIIGDDDIPEKNLVRLIIDLLINENPDLVYLNNKSINNIFSTEQRTGLKSLSFESLSKYNFLKKTNIWTTFISAVIVNMDTYKKQTKLKNISRFKGTFLSQLEWVFEVILSGSKLLYVDTKCILAHSNNSSGGYKLITVFSENFKKIVSDKFNNNENLRNILLSSCLYGYIPRLVYKLRFRKFGDFNNEDYLTVLKNVYNGNIFFWVIIFPICRLPYYGSFLFAGISKPISKFIIS